MPAQGGFRGKTERNSRERQLGGRSRRVKRRRAQAARRAQYLVSRAASDRRLVRRRQLSRLLHRHLGFAAEYRARAGLRAEYHRPARFALVTSSELVGHLRVPPLCCAERKRRRGGAAPPPKARFRGFAVGYFLLIGSPQQMMFPCSEPRVTTNSAPHLPQKYRFPVSVAT